MAVTNLLKTQVDLPVFEWMRFAPTATSATSNLASSDLSARYMYYLVAQAMWRYDTYADTWQECAAPNIAPLTAVSMKYSAYSGYRGHAVTASSTTITVAGFSRHAHLPDNIKIRIIAGKGAGQERTITELADAEIADFGVITAFTNTTSLVSIADSTKKWRVNQWDGYQCRLVYGTGQTQIRRISFNDTTSLTFFDTNFQAIDSFNNTGFSAVPPYAVPATTAGSQAHYVIESSVLTVDTAWDVTPDESSVYIILAGGLWLISSAAATPFASMQFYDILTDTWMTKTPIGGHLTTALGTDFSIDRTGEAAGAYVGGLTASSATTRTLVNSGVTMGYDRYANYQVRITSGTGIGQRRRIVGHNNTTMFIARKWDITPDATSQYAIYGDTDKLWLSGNASSALLQYGVEADIWSTGHMSDTGISRNISATPYAGVSYGAPHEGYAISGIVFNATGILTVAVNVAGTNYVVGDLVTIITGGGNATVYVTGVTTSGAVTSIQLANSGTGYTAGSTATSGGSGSGLTIITTVGKSAVVTTATNHDFRHGESVTIAGCATETTFNAVFATIGIGSQTTFSIAANAAAAASPTAANSQSVTVLVDASATWDANEHTGKIVHIQTGGITPTIQSRKITSNTATTITVPTITAAVNGTSRYVIQEINCFGSMQTNKVLTKQRDGWATSGTATTLVDSTKNWNINQWVNCKVRVVCGTGIGNESIITSNTATTLTVSPVWNVATPDATTKYEILDAFGVVTTGGVSTTITDANKNWTTNILAGKRVRIVAGTGIGNEIAITSNTATVMTIASAVTTDTTSVYVIYEIAARGLGTNITWLYGIADTAKAGRWLISNRGGASNGFDIYDIPSNTWDISPVFTPQTVTLTTGSMFVYDGADTYFFTKDATGRVYSLDLQTFQVNGETTTPYAQGSAIIGSRMEVVTTADGLKYLYIMRHSGQEMWRTLRFW
jgi:hypothetical protein